MYAPAGVGAHHKQVKLSIQYGEAPTPVIFPAAEGSPLP